MSPLSPSTTVPSPPVTPDASSQNSTLAEISDQLAYLTLQSAEIAEEAKYTGTPLNRALFTLHLARRIAKETSPAARRHREWRQTRVRRFTRELSSSCLPSEQANELSCGSGYYCEQLNAVQYRLAGLVGKHLLGRDLSGPETGDTKGLMLCLGNVKHRSWMKGQLQM